MPTFANFALFFEKMPADLEVAKYYQEWWKVGVSALTPLAIAVLTFYISNNINERQSALRISENTVAEKQRIYSEIGKKMNIIYIYVNDIGDFRSFKPQDILEMKRETDRTFYTYKPYWSKTTIESYDAFMKSCFRMYAGAGTDAKIKSGLEEKHLTGSSAKFQWDDRWDDLFTKQYDNSSEQKYNILVQSFLKDIATSQVGT